MASNDILIGFALDQSGSMSGTEKETTAGFNAFIEEQASQPGHAWLTFVLFDTSTVVRYTAGDLKLVDPLGTTANPYNPSGGTALYDAVAETVHRTTEWLTANPGFDGQVIIAVLTDGGENSSTKTTIDDLNTLIRDTKETGWQYAFLGSSGASWTEGRTMAAAGMSTLNFAGAAVPGSTQATYAAFASSVTQTRQTGSSLQSSMAANTAHLNADPALSEHPGEDATSPPRPRSAP